MITALSWDAVRFICTEELFDDQNADGPDGGMTGRTELIGYVVGASKHSYNP